MATSKPIGQGDALLFWVASRVHPSLRGGETDPKRIVERAVQTQTQRLQTAEQTEKPVKAKSED